MITEDTTLGELAQVLKECHLLDLRINIHPEISAARVVSLSQDGSMDHTKAYTIRPTLAEALNAAVERMRSAVER